MSIGAPARGGVGGLAARLSALERNVTNLAQQVQRQAGSESLSPNYLTANAAGQVGANFTGLVNALGVILPTALAGFQPPSVANNQIVWQDSGSGALVANIQGFANDAGNTSGINVGSKAEANTWQNYASLNASSHAAASASASLQISQQNEGASGPPGTIGGWTEVDVFVGAISAMIMDSAGRSSFVQLGAPGIPAQMCIDGLFSNAFNVAAGTVAGIGTFFTARNSWTAAVMIGAFSGLNTSPLTWDFTYNGGNSFSVRVFNNSVAAATGTWLGAVLGH